jgi:N-acetylmuramoyl-L-alanine amidase
VPSFNACLAAIRLIFTVLLLGLGPASAAESTPIAAVLPDILAVRVTTTADRARLILDLSQPTKFAIVALDGPDRIAVDVRAGLLKFDTQPPPAEPGLVSSYAVAMAEPGRARAILTLAGPAQVQQAYVLEAFADQPARLVVDLIPDAADGFAKRVAADAAAAATAPEPLTAVSTPPGGTAVAVAATPAGNPPATASPATTVPATPPPAATAAAKPKPLIVLDPGHGGIDSGARAPNGVMEKNIVLAFARKLQALLVKSGRFDVALTRTDDSYLTLEQRVALARTNKADLFISLHADTFQQSQIHGASIYTRDEQATDVLDKVLADNENKTDIVAGFAVPKMTPAVVDVLVDLMRRQMRKQSFTAAEAIIHELQPSVELRRFPVRQADFFVLQAPDVPSMLIELGFLSNADDIANLQRPEWQDRVADAVARGLAAYFDGLAAP